VLHYNFIFLYKKTITSVLVLAGCDSHDDAVGPEVLGKLLFVTAVND